jgi:hypothetical protein
LWWIILSESPPQIEQRFHLFLLHHMFDCSRSALPGIELMKIAVTGKLSWRQRKLSQRAAWPF